MNRKQNPALSAFSEDIRDPRACGKPEELNKVLLINSEPQNKERKEQIQVLRRNSFNISHAQCNPQEQKSILGNLKQYLQNHSSFIEDQFVSARIWEFLSQN